MSEEEQNGFDDFEVVATNPTGDSIPGNVVTVVL